MFFKSKSKINLIEYKPEELKPRSEWLFWSLFIHLQEDIKNLNNIFEIETDELKLLQKDALFETLLYSVSNSLAVLRDKLSKNDREIIIQEILVYMEIFFPNYKYYEIIDIFSNYLFSMEQEIDYKKLQNEFIEYFIERISKLFRLDKKQVDNQRTKDLLFMEFSHGWTLALDAFTSVAIKQVEGENQMARQKFRDIFLQANQLLNQEESDAEKEKREKWEKSVNELHKIVRETKDALTNEIDKNNISQ